MNLSNLIATKGARKKRKRVGRGDGSGSGKTSAKGHKGQKARSGGGVRPGFEGGQMPLIRRLPKRGFINFTKKQYAIVNLSQLDSFDEGSQVSPEILLQKRIVRDLKDGVKILSQGELSKKLVFKQVQFSESAKQKVLSIGCSIEAVTNTPTHAS